MSKKLKSLVFREKAGRRSPWTCNFYLGCSNSCTYCCCTYIIKTGWSSNVKLIRHFRNEEHALEIFREEISDNLDSLRERGRLFFSLTTDAMLPATKNLTFSAMRVCHDNDVPFKVLTKCTDWVDGDFMNEFERNGTVWGMKPKMNLFAFGFSLTGHDEIEIGAGTNEDRIDKLIKIKSLGFKTFLSFEPVIDYDSTFYVIEKSYKYCDFMRIGLLNGPTRDRNIDLVELQKFFDRVSNLVKDVPIYWGDSIVSYLKIDRQNMPSNCVTEELF
jgi:DNA repair photolyase